MARKNVATPFRTLSAQSLAADFETSPMNVEYLDNVGILIDATAITDNLGTFSVWVRFVPAEGRGAPSNWAELTLDSVPTLTNTDETLFINLNQVDFTEVKLVFSAAGATPDGVADIWISARQVGG